MWLAVRGNSSAHLNVIQLVAVATDAPSLMKTYHYLRDVIEVQEGELENYSLHAKNAF